MKHITQKMLAVMLTMNLLSGVAIAIAQEDGSWSTTYPSYDTGSWSTTYPTYDTGSWSTTYPTYDTGTIYPTYDTGVTYSSVEYGTVNYGSTNYSTSPSWTGYNTGTSYSYPSYTYTQPTYTQPVYTQPTYTQPVYTQPVVTQPTVPVTTVTRCSDGTIPSPTTGCNRTTTLPVTNNTVCSDGFAPTNGSCTRTNIIPTNTNTVCSDGQLPSPTTGCNRTVVAPVVTTQLCWDGSRISVNSICPAQYKVCANGTSIPVNQTCYVGNTYVPYVPPQTIKFNNVITSVATEITLTSARCNGIGLIASGAQSTGWFEYGETSNLGRETAKANIGSSPTAPFSNVLTNLKPRTTYYCRAVMQNQYGVVKGEIVAFTTKTTAVTYVKPIVKSPVTKTVTKTNQVLCVDGTYVTVGSKSASEIINNGQKLISLQIEKVGGNLTASSVVNYKLTLKNVSDSALTGVTVKVTIPQEITLTNASAGNYDPITHVLTVSNVSLSPYGEMSINWTGTVAKDAVLGKSMVTTAYTNYSVPGTTVEDEVTAYVVGSVASSSDAKVDTGSKKVIGASDERGFLPNSLVEWLALIAILFIIFILGRSLYSSYSTDRRVSH